MSIELTADNRYNLAGELTAPGATHDGAVLVRLGDIAAKWSAPATFIPQIGSRLFISMNGFGLARVAGYFVERGWLGVECVCDSLPGWYLKQHGKGAENLVRVFGAEVKPIARPFMLNRTENSAKSKGAFRMQVVDTATGAVLDTRNTGNAYTAAVVLEAANVEGARRCVLSYSRTEAGAMKLFNDYARRCAGSALKLAGIAIFDCTRP